MAAFLSLSFYIFLNGIGLQYGSRFVRAFKFVLALPVYFFVAGLGCLLIVVWLCYPFFFFLKWGDQDFFRGPTKIRSVLCSFYRELLNWDLVF